MPDTNFNSVALASGLTVGGNSAVTGNHTVTGNLVANGYTFRAAQVLAAAGATQGNAGVITKSVVIVTVTASTQGVKLPVAATNLEIRVHVPGTVGAKVYPNTNGKLDASSTNTAVVLAAGKSTIYFARDTTRWVTLKGA